MQTDSNQSFISENKNAKIMYGCFFGLLLCLLYCIAFRVYSTTDYYNQIYVIRVRGVRSSCRGIGQGLMTCETYRSVYNKLGCRERLHDGFSEQCNETAIGF